jgi:hypothetical protein
MQPAQQAIEHGTAALVSGATAASALVLTQEWALALFGQPLVVVLAGFAGTFYGLSYRDPMKPGALWMNIVITTFMATAGASLLATYYTIAPAGLAGLAAVSGFVLQVLQPWLKKNLPGVLDGVRDKYLPRRRDDDGGQS